jgi:hypothetical protein
MSLAFYASPFETDNEQNNGSSIMARKKNAAKTQKMRPTAVNSDRVNSLLQSIHNSIEKDSDSGNSSDNENDDEHNMFNPPSPPMSMGVQNTILKENAEHSHKQRGPSMSPSMTAGIPANADTTEYSFLPSSRATQPPPTNSLHHMQMFNDNADTHANLNAIQAMQGSAEEYYKKMIPSYGPATKQYHAHQPPMHNHHQQQQDHMHQGMHPLTHSDNVMEKLNYMINLLEENHDERTGNVTEEVVLYSFLGVFIIFIADSFARVGKYTR